MDFPQQQATVRKNSGQAGPGLFDVRQYLHPRRLTLAMWDQTFLLRHCPGGGFDDFDRVLDQTIERGYNTVRLDPMPQWVDLSSPEKVYHFDDPKLPFIPWGCNRELDAPLGQWTIEFMEKLLARPFLHYTLSAWWMNGAGVPGYARMPRNHAEGAEIWVSYLRQWKKRFGFDRLVYVDLANEVPYFFPGFFARIKPEGGDDWWAPASFAPQMTAFLAKEMNDAMKILQGEFPELRFTASIHGDLRWLDVPLHVDCLDVHFYSDADPRWSNRTRFGDYAPNLFKTDDFHQDFSGRCTSALRSVGPMMRQLQRHKLAGFANWAQERGTPLTTSESWSSWFYRDSPNLNWDWLLEWSEWSVEDAIEFGMWGWTPHNYLQPQFANWQDVKWHQRLTDRFLKS